MLTEISRKTLPDQIAQQLIDFIAAEGLTPGDLLPSTAKLSESFGVSRPVVREGLRALASLGIIEIVNGKGAVVKPLDDKLLQVFFHRAVQLRHKSIIELMEVRQPLEVQSAFLATERAAAKDLAKLETIVVAMAQNLHNLEVYANLDVEFHLAIASAASNTMMYFLIGSIRESLEEAILRGLRSRHSDAELERVQETHEMIFEAIKGGNPAQAAKMMAVHFDEAVMALLRECDSQELVESGSVDLISESEIRLRIA
ncbi:MAG: FadR family transcriptional regulator [Anaerolineae bacterium]|nr:FadR family transcriptional regulator [Anaerolineae bacterium]